MHCVVLCHLSPCACRRLNPQVNPFVDHICTVFSSSNDGDMTFEDFLDMMSVFSDNCPKNVKVEYAFRIFGEPLSAPNRPYSSSQAYSPPSPLLCGCALSWEHPHPSSALSWEHPHTPSSALPCGHPHSPSCHALPWEKTNWHANLQSIIF